MGVGRRMMRKREIQELEYEKETTMPTRADFMKVAKQIADYMNAFHLAFKTYKVTDFDDMIRAVAGGGARVSTDKTAEDFENMLQERGFLVFPKIGDAGDGHVRVFRANSVIASLLSAFRYPGQDGDNQLASLLRSLQSRRRPDDFANQEAGESPAV